MTSKSIFLYGQVPFIFTEPEVSGGRMHVELNVDIKL